jgi:SSS family solute:Na+ symporter
MSPIDIGILVVYLLGMLAMGVHFARRGMTSDRFMAAGRSLPAWVVGLSIIGTYVSSLSFLGNPGAAYGGTWNMFVFALGIPLAAWVATRFFVPYYRRTGHVSAYSHLETRFGPWARVYAVVCYLLFQLGRMGSIMYLMSLPLERLLGIDIWIIILVMGVLVTAYTLLGGIEAVIWTDVVQTIVLVSGAVISVLVLLFSMPEGPGQLFSIAWENGKFGLGGFGLEFARSTFWLVLLVGIFENLRNFGIDQAYIQRYIAAGSDAEAKRSVWVGGLTYIPVSAALFFVGTALFAYYTARPELLPANVADANDKIFPHFIVSGLPVGLSGLLVAAIFAAGMSTVDSGLNCCATLTLVDVYKRYIKPEADEKTSMRVLQISTVAWGLLAVVAALAMIGVGSALNAWWQISGAFGGGMLGLFLLGFISKRASSSAAIPGVAGGVALVVWMVSSQYLAEGSILRSPFHGFFNLIFGTLAVILIGFAVMAVVNDKGGAPSPSDDPAGATET